MRTSYLSLLGIIFTSNKNVLRVLSVDGFKPSQSGPTLTPAPPLPITGRQDEQVVEYDVSLPELADYDLVEYTVELGANSIGPRPRPSPALLSALSP